MQVSDRLRTPIASTGYVHAHGYTASESGHSKGSELSSVQSALAKTSDYSFEEQSFVVLIGKQGIIGAFLRSRHASAYDM